MDNIIKAVIGFCVVALIYVGYNSEYSRPAFDINSFVNETNFVLDDMCSATLVSIKPAMVLTANHCVVDNSGKVRVAPIKLTKYYYEKGVKVGENTLLADVVANDDIADLALLKIKLSDTEFSKAATISDMTLYRTQEIWTMGNPALYEATLHRGWISGGERQVVIGGKPHRYMQVNAGLIGGNSGGAVFDKDTNELIGVVSAGYGEWIGFIVPLPVIRDFLTERKYEWLLKNPKRT